MIRNPDSIRARAVAALKEGRGYDFLLNHSYEMDRDDIARVAAELAYTIYSRLGEKDSIAFEQEVAESLEKYYWDDSDYE